MNTEQKGFIEKIYCVTYINKYKINNIEQGIFSRIFINNAQAKGFATRLKKDKKFELHSFTTYLPVRLYKDD